MLKGFDNVSLSVADMDRAVGFYRDLLGMRVKDTYGPTMTFMGIEGATTDIMLAKRENPVASNGYICLVVDDCRARKPELEARGVIVDDGPYHIPTVGYGMDFKDPDGNKIVIIDHTELKQA